MSVCSAYCGVLRCKLEPHHEDMHVAKGSGLLWADTANGAGYLNPQHAPTLQEQVDGVIDEARLVDRDMEDNLAYAGRRIVRQLETIRDQRKTIDALTDERDQLRRVNIGLEEREHVLVNQLADALSRMTEAEVKLRELEETTTQPSAASDPHFVVRMQLLEELNTALMRIWQLDLRRNQADQF